MRQQIGRPLIRILSLAWVPLTASFVSLLLSVTSIVVATREPEVLLLMPSLVRVAQGEDFGRAYLYLQPAFVSTGQNDRVEVISDMALRVDPADGGEPVEFSWDEQARLVGGEGDELSYEYVADAVPLLVSPNSAQSPLGLFNAPDGWYFAAGTYRFTLRATRVVAEDALEGSFEITFGEDQIVFLDDAGGQRFLTFPIATTD